MAKKILLFIILTLFISVFTVTAMGKSESGMADVKTADFPVPPSPTGTGQTQEIAVLAGGCFWGVEAVFEELKGVEAVVSGYAGGSSKTADYRQVSTGRTGHAESVRIVFDPSVISYGTLLQIFFSVAHDPTQLNYQGPDHGTQYRSAIFYTAPEQKQVAEEYIKQLNDLKIFPSEIVTEVSPLDVFYPAEAYHQDFMKNNPDYPYIVYWDKPKLEHLRSAFPGLLADPVD